MTRTSLPVWLVALCVPLAAAVGCSQGTAEQPPTANIATDETTVVETTHEHDHSGWWCTEHGVPEEECGLCNAKLAAEFQRNGDWCKKHDRPDSQCFLCHPELEAAFAARYEAKYGKQPPKPEG